MSRLPLHRCFPPEPNEAVRDVSIAELTQKWPEKNETFYVRVSPAEVVPRLLRSPASYLWHERDEEPAWCFLHYVRQRYTVEIYTENGQGRPQNVCFEDAPYVASQLLRARAGLYIVRYSGATYMEKPLGVTFADTPGIHAMGQNMLAIAPLLNRDGDHAIGMRVRRFYFDLACVEECPLEEAKRLEFEKNDMEEAFMPIFQALLRGETVEFHGTL